MVLCNNFMLKLRTIFVVISIVILCPDLHAIKLTPYIPENNPTKTAVIICPGGSYFWLDKKAEGEETAMWLRDNGIAAFVLEYRCGGFGAFIFHLRTKGHSFPAGFEDLRDAIDHVRTNAEKYGISPDRIGCLGYSAGGHLVMHAALQLSGRQDAMAFVAPIYPVVSMTHKYTHKRSRRGLLGEHPSSDMMDSLSLENHVTPLCPPVFLMNCDDDPIVHPHNAELLDSALTAHNVPHHYEHYKSGGHGFGVNLNKTTREAIQWKHKFIDWLYGLMRKEE